LALGQTIEDLARGRPSARPSLLTSSRLLASQAAAQAKKPTRGFGSFSLLGLRSTGLLGDSATPNRTRRTRWANPRKPNRIRIHRHITRSRFEKAGRKAASAPGGEGRGGRSAVAHFALHPRGRACVCEAVFRYLKVQAFLPQSSAIMLPIGPMKCIIGLFALFSPSECATSVVYSHAVSVHCSSVPVPWHQSLPVIQVQSSLNHAFPCMFSFDLFANLETSP
jgi:hypothetical protein